MSMSTQDSLINIATNHNLRIHKRIKMIKESDGKKWISTPDEAKAIIAIPAKDLIFTDNKEGLSIEKMNANNYLKDGGKNLWDDLETAYNYCKEKSCRLISKIQDYWNHKSSIIDLNK